MRILTCREVLTVVSFFKQLAPSKSDEMSLIYLTRKFIGNFNSKFNEEET